MKLEIKYLAPYLPYNLKCNFIDLRDNDSTGELYDLATNSGYECASFITDRSADCDGMIHFEDIKPLLLPLSELTNELLDEFYKGRAENKIIVSDYSSDGNKTLTITVSYKMMGDAFTDFIINRNSIDYTDYWIVGKLLSMHFDVFGLIEKGLAIDKTTIK